MSALIIQKNLMGMTATGFGVYVTRYIGMQDPDRLKQAVRQAVFGAAALTLACSCSRFLRFFCKRHRAGNQCGTLMIQRKVNRMEDVYISAYMYAILVEDLFLTPVYACEQAASYVLAQNVGAGKAELVRKYHWRLNRLSWKFCRLLLPAVWLFGTECVRLVAGQASEEVAVCAGWWLRICVFAFPALSIDQIGRIMEEAPAYFKTEICGYAPGII